MKMSELDTSIRNISAQEGLANIDLAGNRMLVEEAGRTIAQLQDSMNSIQQALNEAKALQAAPREVIRDKSGKAVGVTVGNSIKQVIRGIDGKVQGVV